MQVRGRWDGSGKKANKQKQKASREEKMIEDSEEKEWKWREESTQDTL